MKLLDVQHPFFRPLWRRIVIVVVALGWALIELALGNGLWALVFGAIGVYCAHQFFVAFDPQEPDGS
ncbi:hypothetical protein [Pacificoceanicola onchidii]|uniref:hypothetical protein n=1 Tax=Pacificoceanicola onchidii TaxID=2562685 RepID=UPI0010A36486|nr:hypothetical protein [Pacificoceanicola onchidii]